MHNLGVTDVIIYFFDLILSISCLFWTKVSTDFSCSWKKKSVLMIDQNSSLKTFCSIYIDFNGHCISVAFKAVFFFSRLLPSQLFFTFTLRVCFSSAHMSRNFCRYFMVLFIWASFIGTVGKINNLKKKTVGKEDRKWKDFCLLDYASSYMKSVTQKIRT